MFINCNAVGQLYYYKDQIEDLVSLLRYEAVKFELKTSQTLSLKRDQTIVAGVFLINTISLITENEIMSYRKFYLNESQLDPQFISSREGAMAALLINLVGFLGLFSMRMTQGFKDYENTEQELEIESISSDNHDVSYAIKNAYELGYINDIITSKLLRILKGIKNKEIKDKKELYPNAVRRLLDEIDYFKYRPSKEVYDIIFRFHEGEALSKTTNALYQLAKTDVFRGITIEFRQLALAGQYSRLFKKIPKT